MMFGVGALICAGVVAGLLLGYRFGYRQRTTEETAAAELAKLAGQGRTEQA